MAFDSRKDKWRALLSKQERVLFDQAAEEVKQLVTAIINHLAPQPNYTLSPDERLQAIASHTNELRLRYQACRIKIWQSSDPDEIF